MTIVSHFLTTDCPNKSTYITTEIDPNHPETDGGVQLYIDTGFPQLPWNMENLEFLKNLVQGRENAWNFILKQGKPWICYEVEQNLEFDVFTISYDPKLFLGNLTE